MRDYPLTRSQLLAKNMLIFIGTVAVTCFFGWLVITMWFQLPFER